MNSYDREQRALTISTLLGLFAVALALLAWFTAPAKAADEPTVIFSKEYPHKWYLTCFEKYGTYDGCMLTTLFVLTNKGAREARAREVRLGFVLNKHNKLIASVSAKGWRFTESKKYKMHFYFTKNTGAAQDHMFTVNGEGVSFEGGYQGAMGGGDIDLEFLGEVMITNVLGVGFNEKYVTGLTMQGSYKAVGALMKAHARYSNGEAPSGDTFPSSPSTSSLEDTF